MMDISNKDLLDGKKMLRFCYILSFVDVSRFEVSMFLLWELLDPICG